MKKLTVIAILILATNLCFAQKASIKGVVTDTVNKENLHRAVVSVLHGKDSVLYKFTRTSTTGAFELNNLKSGKYVMLVSYPTYADYYDTLTLHDDQTVDLGKMMVTTKAHLLSDVTVVSKIAAIRMKGDTLVYKADSFKVKDGASVEDLLKKFPGIQVDKNGNITSQGTKVEKVLVDGEEFFGDDPTIATKNLDAKMVNEVQVFDKKSDQAVFTGIDDGQTTRTINLKLKDDAKKGWFGKVEVGGGTQDVWNNSLMANTFKNKRKLSFYGIASSTGKTGLNWEEAGKFGSENNSNMVMSDDGGMYFNNGGGDAFDNSNYWGEGIPKSWSAGVNYGNKYNSDKQTLNGSYKYAKINNEGGGTTVSQSILPDTLFFNNERRKVYGSKDRHSANASFDWMIDSSFSAKITASGNIGRTEGVSSFLSEALNAQKEYVNQSNRINSSKGDNKTFKGSLLLRKRFKKEGRTMSFNLDESYNDISTDAFVYQKIDYFNGSTIYESDTTDQKKINTSNTNTITTRLSYTDKLVKNLTGEITYGFTSNAYNNKVSSFDKNSGGKYESLNTLFSNNYDFSIFTNRAGATLRYNTKKITTSLGGDIAYANFKQTDLIKDTSLKYNYTNFFPRSEITYKFNANKRVSLRYNGSTKQPSIQQIQPVVDNTNTLIQYVGNPDLKQEFTHRFNLNANNWNVLKNRGYWLGGNFSTTSNAIRTNTVTNNGNKTVIKYVNTTGNYNFGGWAGFNMKIPKLDMYFNMNYNFNSNHSVGFVNDIKNITTSGYNGISVNFSKDKEKKYNFWVDLSVNYNSSKSSIRPDVKNNYWSFNPSGDFTYQLPWKLEINNNIEWNLREKTELFSSNNSLFVWNAYLSKKFLKNDKAQIRFSAFDMLNQNIGYRRDISSTTLTENSYTQLSRYFMLSLIWNFSKGGAALK